MSDAESFAISDILIQHTIHKREARCHCGHEFRLGESFTLHQADQIVAAQTTGRTRII